MPPSFATTDLTDDVDKYKLKERVVNLREERLRLSHVQGELTIYIPRGDNA